MSRAVATNNFDFTTQMHVWANGFSGAFFRAVFEVEGPEGVDCQFGSGSSFLVKP